MFRGFLLGVLLTIVVAAAAAYVWITSGLIPANADGQPLPGEVWAASASLDATLKREAPTHANPISLTEAHLQDGLALYAQNCVFCHGGGDGKAETVSAVAKGEYPSPPQLARDGVEDDPEGYTYWKLEHGIRLSGMPAWKTSLSEDQIWTLTLFLKHMDKLPPAVDGAWKALKTP